MVSYELHPLCTLFPRLSGAEFEALRDDIKANGLREPITLHEGMILDGGNRYRACIEAGVEPQFREFGGGNLVSFVLSANLHRRHMTSGQQAAIVSSAQDWAKAQTHGGRRRAADQGASLHLDSVQKRAAESGASLRTQKMADKVVRERPDLAKQVAQGEKTLPDAIEAITGKRPGSKAKEATRADGQDDFDPVAELEKAHAEITKLTGEIEAAEADDAVREAVKWRRSYEHAQRQQSEAMDRAKKAVDREAWTMRQLRRCGKAVGQDDPTKIAASVEAFVRQYRKEAA